MEPKKRIKILTRGAITAIGCIYGPILTPYYEKESIIFKLVAAGVHVVEVLDDGSEIKLGVDNYKANNNIQKKKAAKSVAPKAEDVNTTPVVESTQKEPENSQSNIEFVEPVKEAVEPEEVQQTTEAETVEETVEETEETAADNNSYTQNEYKYNNKHNKKHR